MNDCISRAAAVKAIMGEHPDAHYPDWYAAIIKELPAVIVRPVVRGKWITCIDQDGNTRVTCSNCDTSPILELDGFWHRTDYCPNCGADMREVSTSEESFNSEGTARKGVTMTMSNADICLEFRQAKNKANQVTVLADLNQCDRKKILEILEANGEKVDKRLWGHPNPAKKTAGEKKTTPAKRSAPVVAPNPEGVTLTRDETEALLTLLTDVLPEYIEGKAANMDLLEIHQLTGIYQKCL